MVQLTTASTKGSPGFFLFEPNNPSVQTLSTISSLLSADDAVG